MKRAPRRPRRLRLLASLFGLSLLALGPWAYAATSAPEVPTIRFTATGTVPLVCGSRPDVTTLVIKHGTRVIIANGTGVTATVDIGRRRVLTLADGSGALVRLRRGQYDLQMIPNCVVVSETEKAVVNVLTAAQMIDLGAPTATPTVAGEPGGSEGEQGGTDEPDVTAAVETSSDPASTDGSSAVPAGSVTRTATEQTGTTTGPAVVAIDRTAPPVLEGRPNPDDIAVIEVDAIQRDEPSDTKGLRLVGAIATICVLGVTAAIIRAIVSERTSRPVG